ncbi:MAG TPA: hypothetical protein VGG75_40075 [Trebonia sp.]
MNGVLAWLGVILLAWVAACAVMVALFLRAERCPCEEEAGQARQRARDEAMDDAIARLAAHVDEKYRALCEREGGGRG